MNGNEDWDDVLGAFRALRSRVRTELGGPDRIAAVRARGRRTVRERIDDLLDPGTFDELGTFAWPDGRESEWLPGDGKIGGHGRIDGRPVTVVGDDGTVLRASSSVIGQAKVDRLYDQALRAGNPLVFLGECGGGRIPDILGAVGFTRMPGYLEIAQRGRRIPVAVAILGDSFGGSTLLAGLADFTVQLRDTCLAVTSPRVIEVATGQQVTADELGGADVHAKRTGLIDAVADDEASALAMLRRFLSYLPSSSESLPPRAPAPDVGPDDGVLAVVPRNRRRGYDMRSLVRRVCDPGTVFELKAAFGASLLTALARIGGHPVGIIASQPIHMVGALTPDSCDKAARLICLCDAFGLPVVMLQDTPGFLVGVRPEHERMVAKAMLFQQAYALATVPKITVLLRKGFGLGYYIMGGNDSSVDLLYAWAGAEIGFMDPQVGANVIYAAELAALPPPERAARRQELAAEMAAETDVAGPAAHMKIDEIIDPVDTRPVLARALDRFAHRAPAALADRPLAWWPTAW
jgi:acetyl-CoA carboxylase carboxyltransferase component